MKCTKTLSIFIIILSLTSCAEQYVYTDKKNLNNTLNFLSQGEFFSCTFKNLYVKDVVVIKEDIIAENGVIHIIDCIMFIQPSVQDSRLSPSQKDSFPITSCCMQTGDEVSLWKQNTEKIVY